jgi:hypothetical protein
MKKLITYAFASMLSVSAFGGLAAVYNEGSTVTATGEALVSGNISGMWGTYSGGVFTPFIGLTQSAQNGGYYSPADKELLVALSVADNVQVPVGTPMFLALYNLSEGSAFHAQALGSNTVATAVLTDPLWTAPAFTLTEPQIFWELRSLTSAVFGSYSFSPTGSSIGLVAIPEPSTYALIFGAGVLGLVMFRRFRK